MLQCNIVMSNKMSGKLEGIRDALVKHRSSRMTTGHLARSFLSSNCHFCLQREVPYVIRLYITGILDHALRSSLSILTMSTPYLAPTWETILSIVSPLPFYSSFDDLRESVRLQETTASRSVYPVHSWIALPGTHAFS